MSSIFIERILVSPELGKCDVTFRNGTNIIWAENVTQENNGADFRNSVGKTTFIHLIDYLMGKKEYIKNAVGADGIFIERYMLAEVQLGEEYFTISRRLIDGDENRVYRGFVINSLLSDERLVGRLLNSEEYILFLTEQIYGQNIIIGNKNYITHRNIMSYLIRDQFYGFSKFDSGIKEERANSRKKRLEFLLGLITEDKVELEEQIANLNNEKSKLLSERKTLKNYFDYISKETYSELKKRKRKLEKELEKIKKALDAAAEVRDQIDKRIENSKKESLEITSQIQAYEEELYILRHRISEYKKAVNDIDNEADKIDIMNVAYEVFQKADFERCPFYKENLKNNTRTCDYLQNQGEADQLPQAIRARKKILQIEKKELLDSIKRVGSFIKSLEKKVKQLNKCLTDKQKEQEKLYSERREKYEEIEEEKQRIEYNLELIAKDTRNFEYLDELSDKIDKKKGKIQEKREILDGLQRNRAIELNKYYSKVVVYITNNERMGEINYQTYEPRILYKNGQPDNGAGMKNAAVLAFDIAMLELAINNQEVSKCRPIFLVHDSPKLHDLDLTIYYRLIDYMIKVEQEYKEQRFQYIITTLDITENVSKNIDEFVRLRLNNSGDGGKLFGCTIDIA